MVGKLLFAACVAVCLVLNGAQAFGQTVTIQDKISSSLAPAGLTNSIIRYTPTQKPDDLHDQNIDESWESVRTFHLSTSDTQPLRVFIETSPQETALYKHRYAVYVNNALEQWSQALDGNLKYVITSNPNDAQIKIYWINRFADPEQAGETDWTIGDAIIRIKTADYPDGVIKANIMHELGHALGIAGHSNGNNDIMKSGRNWVSVKEYQHYQPKLSRNDILAIRHLYSPQWKKGEDLYAAVRRNPHGQVLATRISTDNH